MDLRLPRQPAAGLLAAAFLASAAYASIAATKSHFFCDDMLSLFQLRQAGLWRFLWTPVNVQHVPLHRLVTWAIDGTFGFRFAPAVIFLLALHLVAVGMLYRLVTKITAIVAPQGAAEQDAQRLLPAVVAFLYASYPFLGVQLMWFSSGLHRLPYAIATLFAFDRWLAYRARPHAGALLAIAGAMVVATGFYSKGPLLVPHVMALELCLWPCPPMTGRRTRALSLLGLLGLAVLLALGLAHLAGDGAKLRIVNWRGLLLAEGEALRVFLKAFIGQVQAHETVADDWGMWCALVITLGLVFAAVRSRRWNQVVLVTLLGVLALNTALLATSSRGLVWGIMVAQAPRYHWDLIVVALPLASVALATLPMPRARRHAGVTTIAVLIALGLLNLGGFHSRLETRYRDWLQTRRFMDNFQRSLAQARRAVPPEELVFQDELLPRPLFGMGLTYRYLSHMAIVMQEPLQFSDDGKLLIQDNGTIWPKGPNYDPERREKQLQGFIQGMIKATDGLRSNP